MWSWLLLPCARLNLLHFSERILYLPLFLHSSLPPFLSFYLFVSFLGKLWEGLTVIQTLLELDYSSARPLCPVSWLLEWKQSLKNLLHFMGLALPEQVSSGSSSLHTSSVLFDCVYLLFTVPNLIINYKVVMFKKSFTKEQRSICSLI